MKKYKEITILFNQVNNGYQIINVNKLQNSKNLVDVCNTFVFKDNDEAFFKFKEICEEYTKD